MYQVKLDKEDFLRFLLFTASKSKMIRAKRIRGWIFTTLIFLGIGLVFSTKEDKFVAYYFMVAAALSLFFYPFYNRWRYKNYYEKHIRENYQNRIGVTAEVGFEDGFITSKDKTGEEKIKLTEIAFIYEIKNDLFIRVKSGGTIVIPTRMPHYSEFKNDLTLATKGLDIIWNIDLEWKWK